MTLLEIFDPKAPPKPVGIDLGTTNSLVARVRDGVPVVIRDCNDKALVPSVVHYAENGRVVVGDDAVRYAAAYPRETIASVKRLMGRGADDPETKRLSTIEFAAPEGERDAKTIRLRVRGASVTPVEVSAEILKALRARAEDELKTVGGVVITVPAYFDDAQRQATKDAGRLAGLNVLRLLNEPTAAALAYGLEKKKNGLFAVYDLGGGTFDVTILSLDDGVFQVRSTGGDSALGGDDVDRAVASALLERAGLAAQPDPGLVRAALDEARLVKHALTDAEQVTAKLEAHASTFTRADLEAIAAPLLARTGVACRRALRDADVTPEDLDGVILVGGSTRMPAVRAYVAKLFSREPLVDIDPDEVVALGAAIQADILAGDQGREGEVLLLDVLPLSLGLETMGGVVEKILPRNTTIPAGARQVFTTYADNQTGFDLHVVQGERELAADCRSLARFLLKGIPPMPAGLARLEVTFRVDADGLLSVSAVEQTTGIEQKVDVQPSYGLDDDQVEEMLMAALEHGEEDLEKRRLVEERVEAERVVAATRKALAADAALLEPGEHAKITAALEAVESAVRGIRPAIIHGAVEALDAATKAFAGRRMDRAVARAIAGRDLTSVEADVQASRGVDAHVDEHKSRRAPGG